MTAPTTKEWLRAAAGRLSAGSQELTRTLLRKIIKWVRKTWKRTMDWLSDATGIAWAVRLAVLLAAAWLLRKIGVGIAGAAARRLDASPWLMWPALGLWIIAAWRAGHPDKLAEAAKKRAEKKDKKPAADTPAGPSEGPAKNMTIDQIRTLLHTAFGDDDQAHTAVLAERLAQITGEEWTAAYVRAAAQAAGATVEKGVRMPGRSPSTGIRRATVPAPSPDPSPTPPPGPVDGVVVAGQKPATGAATATPTGPATAPPEVPGEGFTITADPANPHRHHVVHHPSSPTA
ncbi:hypothetical protein [Streptomyces jumonjinensis]|uniref:hypothetical protein n=1 Tax=Streptomyces jumonjinensis TaxID=1945 RepID=UPI00379A108C